MQSEELIKPSQLESLISKHRSHFPKHEGQLVNYSSQMSFKCSVTAKLRAQSTKSQAPKGFWLETQDLQEV